MGRQLDETKRLPTFWIEAMKKILLLLLLTGCAAPKQIIEVDTEINTSRRSSEEIDISSISATNLSELLRIHSSTFLDFTIYDTSKKVDPDTGKPPVLADGSLSNDKVIESDSNVNLSDSTQIKGKADESEESTEVDKSKLVTEKKLSKWQRLKMDIGGIAIGAIIGIIFGVIIFGLKKLKQRC